MVSLGRGPDGKRKRKTFYAKTRSEAARYLAQALAQRDRLRTDAGRERLEDYLERWLEEVVKPGFRYMTYVHHRYLVRHHITPALGHLRLKDLRPEHVQELLNARAALTLERGGKTVPAYSPYTIRHIHSTLRRALNVALRWGLVERNAAALVDGPRVPHQELEPLTPEEAGRLLEALEGHRLKALFVLALTTGLRLGEVAGLRWGDIEGGRLTVRRSLQQQTGKGIVFVEPKSARSRRSLPLPEIAVRALEEHRIKQAEARLRAGPEWQGEDLVFTGPAGGPLRPTFIRRNFRAILEQAGLRSYTFHGLRHACASFLLAQKVPVRVIMETLGHTQTGMTMRYAHLMPGADEAAARAIDEALKPPS